MSIDLTRGATKKQLMQPVGDFVVPVDTTLPLDATVKEALKAMRQRPLRHAVNYFYATDSEGRLVGIASTRDLLFADPEKRVREVISKKVLKIEAITPLKKALELVAEKQLLALPVVDEAGVLQGILEIRPQQWELPENEEELHRKIDQDVFQMVGLSLEQTKVASSWDEFRYRMPWLFCNLAGGLTCAFIAGLFEKTLASVVVLAMFIPLVLTLCESISMQSMTLSLQFLHKKSVHWGAVGKRLWSEWKAALLIGVTSALLVSGGYLLLHNEFRPLIAIGTSIFVSMVVAALLGTLTPILFHALRWDPKVAAGPIVLTLADVVGLSIYLGLAAWWI